MITHDPENRCFRSPDGAILDYTVKNDRHILDHTEVPPAFRGRGIAERLAFAALDHARDHGWRIVPACSFIEGFLHRHPEYADLVDRDA